MKRYKSKFREQSQGTISSSEIIKAVKFMENLDRRGMEKILSRSGHIGGIEGGTDELAFRNLKFEFFIIEDYKLTASYQVDFFDMIDETQKKGQMYVYWSGSGFSADQVGGTWTI